MKAITLVLASALITGLAIKATPVLAQAAPAELAVSVVRTADLDLSSALGQRTLDRRLASAAREVCGTASDADLEGKNQVRDCRDQVLATARAQGATLTAHNQRGGIIAVTAAR